MTAFRLMLVIIILITKLVEIIMTRRKMNGYKISTNGESLNLFLSLR